MKSADYLKPGGLVSQKLAGYEHRVEQEKMATAVERTFAQKRVLLAEAGTGVGKSFAYLLPAALWALESKERVVVSTNTINLQEQLITKDLPFIQNELGIPIVGKLAKGQGNYTCLRRLLAATTKGSERLVYFREQDLPLLGKVEDWFYRDTGCDGTRSSLPFEVPQRIWSNIQVEAGGCSGRKCRYFENCPYLRDRMSWDQANILVVNHALFFVDLALRAGESPFLPSYGAVVFDEAHTLEDAACDHMGYELNLSGARRQLSRVYDFQHHRGLFSASHYGDLQQRVFDLNHALTAWFAYVSDFREKNGSRLRGPGKFEPLQGDISDKFLEELSTAINSIEDQESDMYHEARAVMLRMLEVLTTIKIFVGHTAENCVYWVDGIPDDPWIRVTPISIAEKLKQYLWSESYPKVLTSATISTGGPQGSSFLKGRLGIAECDEIMLGSPFNYREQVKVYIPADMPDPTPIGPFRDGLVRYIEKFVHKSKGRAFVLFTSIVDMKYCSTCLYDKFVEAGYLVLVQDGSVGRSRMLEQFREDGQAVLFGVSSFWQGVDVRGEALSNVIITRLPFEVPDHPVVEARREEIADRGGSDFHEYTLPIAVLKLKQGFGRLIRTRTDTGSVVILDPRVLRKSYGRRFIQSLPPCPVITDPAQM